MGNTNRNQDLNFSNSPDKVPVATKYRESYLLKLSWEHGIELSSVVLEKKKESLQHLCSTIKYMRYVLYFTFFGHVLDGVWGI